MRVKFIGASDVQVNCGGGSDPRKCFVLDEIYEVVRKEVYDWSTKYYIMVEGVSLPFNSVCFREV